MLNSIFLHVFQLQFAYFSASFHTFSGADICFDVSTSQANSRMFHSIGVEQKQTRRDNTQTARRRKSKRKRTNELKMKEMCGECTQRQLTVTSVRIHACRLIERVHTKRSNEQQQLQVNGTTKRRRRRKWQIVFVRRQLSKRRHRHKREALACNGQTAQTRYMTRHDRVARRVCNAKTKNYGILREKRRESERGSMKNETKIKKKNTKQTNKWTKERTNEKNRQRRNNVYTKWNHITTICRAIWVIVQQSNYVCFILFRLLLCRLQKSAEAAWETNCIVWLMRNHFHLLRLLESNQAKSAFAHGVEHSSTDERRIHEKEKIVAGKDIVNY